MGHAWAVAREGIGGRFSPGSGRHSLGPPVSSDHAPSCIAKVVVRGRIESEAGARLDGRVGGVVCVGAPHGYWVRNRDAAVDRDKGFAR